MDEIIPLIRAIVDTMEPENAEWTEFSLVIGLNPKGVPVQNFGYAYQLGESPIAIVADDFEFEAPLKSFLNSRYTDGTMPVRLLVQFNRSSGRYNVDFEEQDSTRWQVTPANLDQVRESLRPGLE